MAKILANDGIDASGKKILSNAGHEVVTDKISQENLKDGLKAFDGILVRSATTVRKDIIDANPGLKLIGRAGVGMDNIDVAYAREKGLAVINTPAASSQSVAELVFTHLYTGVRFMHDSNRKMPSAGKKEDFENLKKNYSAGVELKGKTIGIIGGGMIGTCVASMAIGLGMNVLFNRNKPDMVKVPVDFFPGLNLPALSVEIVPVPLDELLGKSDFVTLHVPFPKGQAPLIGKAELNKMKKGAGIVNTARGGVIHEMALVEALNSKHIAFAGLDVFEGEPLVKDEIRNHPAISLSPHIGGSTKEAQERIGIELAEKVVSFFLQ